MRRRRVLLGGLGLLLFAGLAPSADVPPFEVASVRPSTSGITGYRSGCHGIDSKAETGDFALPPLGRCVITDARLSHMIVMAYKVKSIGHIKGAPDWAIAGDERFNVQAKAENVKSTEAELLQMLQKLLEERFKLKYHWETKEINGFALVVDKKGPKLKEAEGDSTASGFAGGKPQPKQPIAFTARKFSIRNLAQMLSQLGPDPVSDETGLTGLYDFKLAWDEENGPSLGTALREQLGLRMEPRKQMVQYFVFESAQRPGEN